jgi:hypothetical protein
LISGDEGIELRFGFFDQYAVFELSPAHFQGGLNRVVGKKLSQRTRDAGIQQDFHAA